MFKSVATIFVAASDAQATSPAFGRGFHQQSSSSPSQDPNPSYQTSFGYEQRQHQHQQYHHQQYPYDHVAYSNTMPSALPPPPPSVTKLALMTIEEPSVVGLSCDSSLSSSSNKGMIRREQEESRQDESSLFSQQQLRTTEQASRQSNDNRNGRTMATDYNYQSANYAMTTSSHTSDPTLALQREQWNMRRKQAKATAIHPNGMHMKQQRKTKTTGGVVGGAIVGGLVLGPVGAVLGGAAGGAGVRRLAKVGEKRTQRRFEQRNFQKVALESSVARSAGIV